MNLNSPQIRQERLCEKLREGAPLSIPEIADDLGISVDTVRRDLIALEQRGLARRVRGGAMPVIEKMPGYLMRAQTADPVLHNLAQRAVALLNGDETIFIDAGTTMNAIAQRLPSDFTGVVITPAPSVALAALGVGANVHLLGGALCPEGAMATGGATEDAVRNIAANVCFLGACGLWADFGLSAEDAGEAGVKRAMALASAKSVVVTSASKFDRVGRHRVLAVDEIDTVVTDADDPEVEMLRTAGVEVLSG